MPSWVGDGGCVSGWVGNFLAGNNMPRALFSVVPQPRVLPKVVQRLARIGVPAHNVSTLRFGSEPTAKGASPPARERVRTPSVSSESRPDKSSRNIHATGQLRWALLGASATGATRRVARALAGMGMPEAAARHFQDLVRMGNTLLCVFCETHAQAEQAFSILQRSGVRDLASTGGPDSGPATG